MLSIGWRANDVRESIWKDDPALKQPLPEAALAAWEEDGDASHLEPYATLGEATVVYFRALTPDEKPIVLGAQAAADNNVEGMLSAWVKCFRIAVSFSGMQESATDAEGVKHRMTVKPKGTPMLAPEVAEHMERTYPGMTAFYGELIYKASFLSDAEKKALSPPSIETPSAAAEYTTVTTAPLPVAEDAKAAP